MPTWTDRVRGVFFEKVEDGVDDLPETLTTPTRPAPTRPASAYRAPTRPAPQVEAVPAAIKAVVDQQFNEAAAPALSAWSDVSAEFASTIPDLTMRTTVVLSTLKRLGFEPAAIYTDIGECREKLTALGAQIQGAKDAELREKVLKTEEDAAACSVRIAALENEISTLRDRALELNEQARVARGDIEQNHASTLRYLEELGLNLDEISKDVQAASPTTPVPAALSGRS